MLPGDIVLTLNGVPMAEDGGYQAYCDVLRTSGTDTMTVEVLRWDTAEMLRGEINGTQELEPILSLTEVAGGAVPEGVEPDGGQLPIETVYDYEKVTDDTGVLTVDVPTHWNDRETAPGNSPEGLAFIGASDDMAAFREGWTHPGLVFYLRPYQGNEWDILSHYTYEDVCQEQLTEEFSDAMYAGLYQIWSSCEGTDGLVVTMLLSDNADSFTAVMTTYVATEDDLEALDRGFGSYPLAAGCARAAHARRCAVGWVSVRYAGGWVSAALGLGGGSAVRVQPDLPQHPGPPRQTDQDGQAVGLRRQALARVGAKTDVQPGRLEVHDLGGGPDQVVPPVDPGQGQQWQEPQTALHRE